MMEVLKTELSGDEIERYEKLIKKLNIKESAGLLKNMIEKFLNEVKADRYKDDEIEDLYGGEIDLCEVNNVISK